MNANRAIAVIEKRLSLYPIFLGLILITLTLTTMMSSVVAAPNNIAANETAFQAFTDAPSKESKQVLQQYFGEQEAHPIEFWTPEFKQLVIAGHPLALEVAFESLPYTDGAVGLHLTWLIGETTRSAPEAFLQALTKYWPVVERLHALDSLLGHLGSDYVDNLPGTIRGLEDRYFSLRNVETQEYNEARDEVLLMLSEMIYRDRKWQKELGPSLDVIDEGE